MQIRMAEEGFAGFRPLEPKLRVIVEGETNAAMHLHGVDRGLDVNVWPERLGEGKRSADIISLYNR